MLSLMELQKDDEKKMVDGCRQIVDCINRMSFNKELNDQQVRSLVKMREIARGVINGRCEKVTESDVDRALRADIDNMVDDCKDILDKIGRMSCKGLNDQQVYSLSRIKELASGVVGKHFEVPRTPRNGIGEKQSLKTRYVCSFESEQIVKSQVDTPSPAQHSHATGTNLGYEFGLEGINELQTCDALLADEGSPVLVEIFEDPDVEHMLTSSDLQEPPSSSYEDLYKQNTESKERDQKLIEQISEMENILKGTHSRARDKMLMEQIRSLRSTLNETSSTMSSSEVVVLGDSEVETRPPKIRARRAPEVLEESPVKARLRSRGGQPD